MELVQVAQHVDDLDRAVAFYEDLLGQKVAAQFDPPGIAFFLLDGTRLLLDVERAVEHPLPGGRRRRIQRRPGPPRTAASRWSPSRT